MLVNMKKYIYKINRTGEIGYSKSALLNIKNKETKNCKLPHIYNCPKMHRILMVMSLSLESQQRPQIH